MQVLIKVGRPYPETHTYTDTHKPVYIPHNNAPVNYPHSHVSQGAYYERKCISLQGRQRYCESAAQKRQEPVIYSRAGGGKRRASANFATLSVADLSLPYLVAAAEARSQMNLGTGGNAYAGTMSTAKYNKNKERECNCPRHDQPCR